MNNESEKTEYFRKSKKLEEILKELNSGIASSFQEKLKLPKQPIVLIMGCARSGGTLMMQYLASKGIFSYPTNLIARFHSNPYLGILVQKSLIEYDPINQMGFNFGVDNIHNSDLGKTIGALQPSEFWYFWRNYFHFGDISYLNNDQIRNVDYSNFLKNLGAFELLYNKPLVLKGAMLNWNIPYLYSIYNNFIFIDLKREPVYNAQSLLLAREKYFGDRNKWYSFKPPEYDKLKSMNNFEQIAGQIFYTRNAIEDGLQNVPDSNKIQISYDSFCNSPQNLLEELAHKFSNLGFELNSFDTIGQKFSVNKKILIDKDEFEQLKKICNNYF